MGIGHAVDFNHVVMNHRGSRLRFTRETLPCRSAAAQMWRKNLDCNVPVQRGIKRFQHDAHATGSNDSRDFIRP